MRRSLLLVVVGLLVGADTPKDEASKLNGTWMMVSGEEQGKKLSEEALQKSRLVIKGDEQLVQVAGDTLKGTHKLNPAAKPRTIDVADTEGPYKGKTLLGIYEVDGDQLKVCFAMPGKPRPRDFASGDILHIWKRLAK
jgi:uncharacterized protein (TIGR03067 family)